MTGKALRILNLVIVPQRSKRSKGPVIFGGDSYCWREMDVACSTDGNPPIRGTPTQQG